MLIELNLMVDLYDTPIEDQPPKLIKKNILYKKVFDTTTVTCEHYINEKGIVLKGYSNIITNTGQVYKVRHSYEEVRDKLNPVKVRGFISYAKKGKYKN